MSFPWLQCTPPRADGEDRRAQVAATEIAHRAGLLYRLGFSEADATARLVARIAWDHEPASKHTSQNRHPALTDQAVAKIVADTYARRPG